MAMTIATITRIATAHSIVDIGPISIPNRIDSVFLIRSNGNVCNQE